MKLAMFFLVCCVVALAAAAPQFITTWPGLSAPYTAPFTRTYVAGPTVVNAAWGTRYVNPGFIGTTLI